MRASISRPGDAVLDAPRELKSQYGHLRTHHGKWMYSDSGGGTLRPAAWPAPWALRSQRDDAAFAHGCACNA